MSVSQLQLHYWQDRYALKDKQGNPVEKSVDDTFHRVADAIGDDDKQRLSFYHLLEDFKFVPGGRILAGAGAESDKTFYNCYVIPVETSARRDNRKPASTLVASSPDSEHEFRFPSLREDRGNDSREAIFDTIGTMVGIMSRGGGVGINWSVLRPENSYLTRVSGHSSGPVGWMDVASKAVGEVIQGGSRRGAAMFMLDDWHPDVLSFINAKRDNNRITNANVSVGISDDFMKALENDEDWTFRFPDTTVDEYDKIWDGDIKGWERRGLPVVDCGSVPARSIWKAMAEAAHASGEPGVIFLDRYNELSTANGFERIVCVNPCGEQGLGDYSVCNLGAMNLYAYIKTEQVYSDLGPESATYFDWSKFRTDVTTAIQFLDNVIDKTPHFLDETQKRQEDLRRIGLGVMGLADALVALGIRYGSPDAVSFTEKVFRSMKDSSILASIALGKKKGPAKAWRPELADRPYLKEFTERNGMKVPVMRNLFLLTQAPTGTTSLLAGVNSGIEPYFALKTWREDRTGGRWVYATALQELVDRGMIDDDKHPDYIVTSKDVTVEEHIAMQAAVQKFVDSSVSKTVNAPAEQTVEETAKAFTLSYQYGLKGVAYYRDGSRAFQVLYHNNPNEKIRELEEEIANLKAKLDFKERAATMNMAMAPLVSLAQDSGCPSCETGDIIYEEGCQRCYNCGWSAC